jgi:hypothetical protein
VPSSLFIKNDQKCICRRCRVEEKIRPTDEYWAATRAAFWGPERIALMDSLSFPPRDIQPVQKRFARPIPGWDSIRACLAEARAA